MKLSGVGFLFRLWYLMEKINAKQNYQHNIILMLQLGWISRKNDDSYTGM